MIPVTTAIRTIVSMVLAVVMKLDPRVCVTKDGLEETVTKLTIAIRTRVLMATALMDKMDTVVPALQGGLEQLAKHVTSVIRIHVQTARALMDKVNTTVHVLLDGVEPPVQPVTIALLIHVGMAPTASMDRVDVAVAATEIGLGPIAPINLKHSEIFEFSSANQNLPWKQVGDFNR